MRLPILIGCIALCLGTSCGNTAPSPLDNVPQGGGTALDIDNPQQTADLGKTVMARVDFMSTDAVAQSIALTANEIPLVAAQQFCLRGTFNKSVGPHLTMGGFGSATFSGVMTVEKLGEDGVIMQVVHEGKYENYSFTDGKGKMFVLSGSVTATTTASLWTGIAAFCTNPTTTTAPSATIVNHRTGTFTLSGTNAAAITFDMQRQIAMDEKTTTTVSGTVTIRSGNDERTCQVAPGGTNDMLLNCQ